MHQALAEYSARAKEHEYDLHVEMALPGRSKRLLFTFNRNLVDVSRIVNVRTHTHTHNATRYYNAAGNGYDAGFVTQTL